LSTMVSANSPGAIAAAKPRTVSVANTRKGRNRMFPF